MRAHASGGPWPGGSTPKPLGPLPLEVLTRVYSFTSILCRSGHLSSDLCQLQEHALDLVLISRAREARGTPGVARGTPGVARGAPGVEAEGVEADCSLRLPRKWSSSLCKGVAHVAV